MNEKMIKIALAAGAAAALMAPVFAQGMAAKAVPAADKQFMMKAAQGGMGEVALGQLAQAHGSGGAKQFGMRMVKDHSKANAQLMQVAAKQSVSLPASPGPEEQATKTRLAKLSGAAFNKAYISDMVADHKKDIADFTKEAATGKDPAVKSFASKTLPTLKMHLKMAQALNRKLTTVHF